MVEVLRLAFPPRGLGLPGRDPGVGAGQHDAQHLVAEQLADDRLVLGAAVLDGVVQQPGDGLVLVAAVGEDDGGDAEEMAEVGHRCPLAGLLAVGGGGVEERLFEPGPELDEASW